ncbi:MAG: TonB-dependent receptor [Bryobacterales bacterium]|nr:TonB-dependent receptor [Bryobacterales bacterium]
MSVIRYFTSSCLVVVKRVVLLIALLGLLIPGALSAQSGSVIDWLTALQEIRARLARNGDVSADLRSLHREISAWYSGRPGVSVRLPEFPAGEPEREQLAAYAEKLRSALEEAERNRPGGAFNAGRVEVNVTADAVQAPTAVTLDESDYRLRNLPKTTDALNLIPGVAIQRIGARNERGVFVRGFDFRQVPLYIDGIPVYVPYDGYVDLDRFLTYDVSEIQVTKGFTSPLYGPNALGGAINMISKAPTKKLNLDLGTGYASGDQVHGFINAGTRFQNFWLQGGFAWLSSDYFPLSGDFRTVPLQPDRDRRNAYQTDNKGRLRAAWTPNGRDQYTFTYARQNGEKGNPPYAGNDTAVRARFWQWPRWDKESFYFIGDKSIGETAYVRARLYYDKFDNVIYAYDNDRYNSQTRPSSFISPYDDDTYGTSTEFGSKVGRRHTVKASFYFKDDTHREGNLGEPQRTFRDQTYSFGAQDTILIASRTTAIVGFSADHLDVLNAQNIVSGAVQPFPRNNVWSYNPQAGIFHALTDSGKLHFTYARKTRLPTIKERYSYRMGQAIPNPDLREERSDNFEVGYSQLVGLRTFLEVAIFQSEVSNSTQRFYVAPNLYQLRNLGEARYLGGEMGLRTSLTRSLQFSTNYTYLSRRNQTMPSVIMLDTPRHKLYSTAAYQWRGRVTLLGDLLYEGGRWNSNDAGRVLRAISFASAGLSASTRLNRQTELQVGVSNLFDRNYFLVEGYPEAGRSYYVNLRYRF